MSDTEPPKPRPRWSDFIETIQGTPILYDKSDEDYKDRDKQTTEWKKIAKSFKFKNETEAKKKWTYFKREYSRQKKKPASGSKANAKQWEYYDLLSFLDDFNIEQEE